MAIQFSEGCEETVIDFDTDFDTDGITLTCTATCLGGASSESVTIRRDTVASSITYLTRTEPNAEGWNNTAVTVEWACADDLSGPAAEMVSQTLQVLPQCLPWIS